MALTYTLIASSVVGSGGASSIDFTSIPATYTDLVLKVSLRDTRTGTATATLIKLNGVDTNMSNRYLEGDGSTAYSSTSTNQIAVDVAASSTASTFANSEIYIPNYTGSNNKSMSSDSVSENNATTAYTRLSANLWSNTAAITSISLLPFSGNFVQYSTAYLYGIKNS